MPAGVGVYNSYTLAVADGASGVQGGVAQQGHASFAAAHQTVVNAASVWAHNHGLPVPPILLTAFPNNAFVEIAFYACPALPVRGNGGCVDEHGGGSLGGDGGHGGGVGGVNVAVHGMESGGDLVFGTERGRRRCWPRRDRGGQGP